jgi:hypothetical protein
MSWCDEKMFFEDGVGQLVPGFEGETVCGRYVHASKPVQYISFLKNSKLKTASQGVSVLALSMK